MFNTAIIQFDTKSPLARTVLLSSRVSPGQLLGMRPLETLGLKQMGDVEDGR